jgi:hypothetical protein
VDSIFETMAAVGGYTAYDIDEPLNGSVREDHAAVARTIELKQILTALLQELNADR